MNQTKVQKKEDKLLNFEDLTIEEIHQLHTIERYQYLNKFPWKLVCEILLLLLTIAQIETIDNSVFSY